jgi:hypothetical protein
MLLITEAQMRYRAVVMPYLLILAALGLQFLLARVRPPAAGKPARRGANFAP